MEADCSTRYVTVNLTTNAASKHRINNFIYKPYYY